MKPQNQPQSQLSTANPLPKPSWIRSRASVGGTFQETQHLVRSKNLNTVCEEAACPNIGECWSKKHVTVMILGSVCTRACAFCNIKTGRPNPIDENEPQNVAEVAATISARHMVITSVDRDDLPDGGANHFVRCIQAVRRASPGTTVEVLTPDFRGKENAWLPIADEGPDVFNHNIETVPSLYNSIRPGARYYNSLRLLENVKQRNGKIFTKSGLMVGLGEKKSEVLQLMDDLRSANVDFITIGQYLRPSKKHVAVAEYITPETFKYYEKAAYSKGFMMVASSPMTRSSYHADADFERLKAARAARQQGH